MKIRILMISLISTVALMGAGRAQETYTIGDDEPLIAFPVKQEKAVKENEDTGFEDISLSRLKKLQEITNDAVVQKETVEKGWGAHSNKILQPDNTVLFPYGLSQAKLKCAKMMLSEIVLDKNEQVLDASAGDTLRWQVKVSYGGNPEAYTPIVLVKPFFGGLTTNLSIITNKRDYNIILTSVDHGEYSPRIGFFYPQDGVERISVPAPPVSKERGVSHGLKIEDVEFNYVVTGDKRLVWYPVNVFDDGHKVYIRMSEKVNDSQLPAFMALGSDGKPEVVNYRYRKPFFMIDNLFDEGVLLAGGNKQKPIRIKRK